MSEIYFLIQWTNFMVYTIDVSLLTNDHCRIRNAEIIPEIINSIAETLDGFLMAFNIKNIVACRNCFSKQFQLISIVYTMKPSLSKFTKYLVNLSKLDKSLFKLTNPILDTLARLT